MSFYRRCFLGEKAAKECGATLEMRRKAKKETKNMARNKMGSCSTSQASEMFARVAKSKWPLKEGENFELALILLRNKWIF